VSRGQSGDPAVAVDGAGVATLAWVRWDRRTSRIEVSPRPAGGRWRPPTELAKAPSVPWSGPADLPPQLPGPGLGDVRVAAGPSGTAAAAWVRVAPLQVEAATLQGGRWSPATVLSDPGTTLSAPLTLVSGARGSTVAMWTAQHGAKGVIQASSHG
jgi:hypothetical protein